MTSWAERSEPTPDARGEQPHPVGPSVRPRPFFIVGCPRSGTTLVRVMLDCHPNLAIPGESHFVVGLAGRRFRLARRPRVAVERILAHHRFERWGLAPTAVREQVARTNPRTYAEAVRAVFEAYAASHGKPRWGDKTPGYVTRIRLLARLFPDAQFVHVIRDGRAVAASVAEMHFGPGDPVSAGFWWRKRVAAGLRDGRRLGPGRYLEVRLEDLIADPEATLRRVLAFLGEEWSPAVLDYRARAEAFLARASGRPAARIHRHLIRPPTPGLRDWQAGLSAAERRLVPAACGWPLVELGYVPAPAGYLERAAARLRWAASLPPQVPEAVALRLRGWRREF